MKLFMIFNIGFGIDPQFLILCNKSIYFVITSF